MNLFSHCLSKSKVFINLFSYKFCSKYRFMFVFTIAITILLGLLSCKKNVDDPSSGSSISKPKIQITSPLPAQSYSNGDTITVQVRVTHEDDMHEVYMRLATTPADSQIYASSVHSHSTDLSITRKWPLIMTAKRKAILKIQAVDHHNMTSTEQIELNLNP